MLMKPNQFALDTRAYFESGRQVRPGFFARLMLKLEAYGEYRRQRRSLWSLDDRLLKDIGLNRGDVDRIASQPFSWLGAPEKSGR
jgi:uncharacterized protein YjiS (DUF1127 family)